MKCLVCGKEYTGAECSLCSFPNVQIAGDYETGLQQLMPTINAHKEEFMKKVTLGIEILKRNPEDAPSVMPTPVVVNFGTVADLTGKETWLDNAFARLPGSQTVDVKAVIDYGKETANKTVSVPNVDEVGLQNIGISVNSDNTFSLMIKNKNNVGAKSAPVSIF